MTNPFVIPIIFQYLAIVISFCLTRIPYILLILKKKVKPNFSTWLLWGIIPLSSFLVSVLSGTPVLEILAVFMAGFASILIVIVALIKKQFYIESKWLEISCFILAITGLIVYFTTKNVLASQVLLALVDFIATLPMLFKIWFDKIDNEPLFVFVINLGYFIISLLTQTTFTIASSLFLVYLIMADILIVFSIIIKNYRLKNFNQSNSI